MKAFQFTVPLTNLTITLGKKPQAGGSRPYVTGAGNSKYTVRDMSGYKLSYETLFYAWRNQGDVYACVDKWSKNVGIAGYKWVNPLDAEKEVDPTLVLQLDSIFNYWQPWRQTKERLVRDLGIAANAYLAITKALDGVTILGLQVIDPRTMNIISNEKGDIINYIQRIGGQLVLFEPEEIIHFRLGSDPANELYGFSPMETVIWEARTDLEAMITNFSFFKNNAQPTVQYILDDNMSEDEQKTATKMIQDSLKGSANSGAALIASGIKEIKTYTLGQKEMQFLEGRSFTTGKICAAYGVPKFMLGYTDAVNNNNGTELKAMTYEDTYRPIEEAVSETINRDFVGRIGLAGIVKHDFNPQNFDKEAEIQERAITELENGAITLRQYKVKTGQDITPEDEANPNFDKYIIHAGAQATLLEDVGVDPLIQDQNGQVAQNLITALKKANNEAKPRK